MKPIISKKEYQEIYDLLNSTEVTDGDCGKLCGAACCTVSGDYSEDDMVIYLLPGEEQLHQEDDDWMTMRTENARDHDFPESWDGTVYFVRCKTPPVCPRDKRPIQCRTFPLAPHVDSDGNLTMVYNDLELPYTCPLIEDEIPLEDDFVEKVTEAWDRLIRDPLIYDLVKADSCEREESFSELIDKLGL